MNSKRCITLITTIVMIAVALLVISGGIYIWQKKPWLKGEGATPPIITSTVPPTIPEKNKSESFGGIGVSLDKENKILTISMVLEGSPAEKAGLKSGDQILKIDNVLAETLSIDEAVKLIKGEAGTEAVLTIHRQGLEESKELKIAVKRAVIEMPSSLSIICVILEPHAEFNSKIPPKPFLDEEMGPLPELDLHAVTPRGQHIGVNYMTGEYEIQIPEANPKLISYDNSFAPEWICLPDFIKIKFYVSAHDIQQWIEENPEEVVKMVDTTEKYDIFARYIDPATDIYTSPTLFDQVINPGEYVIYEVEGVADKVSLSTGIKSNQPPK